jgi:hypothetical protein
VAEYVASSNARFAGMGDDALRRLWRTTWEARAADPTMGTGTPGDVARHALLGAIEAELQRRANNPGIHTILIASSKGLEEST